MKSPPSIKRCRPLLGTFVEITLTDSRPEHVLHDLADVALGRMARVQSLMSFHDTSSELSRLNACGHLYPLPVNEWTREVVAEAVRLGRASEGVFDITAAPELVRGGFLPKYFAGEEHVGGTYRDIILHRDGRISFRQQLLLDLSDIAKGFAVDKAAEFLVEAGVAQATINAGGNLRFIGDLPDVVALRDPRAPRERVIEAKVTAPAMATSAAYFANHRYHTRKVSHILHPRTRKPMRSNVRVSVFARSCMDADALTKVVLLDEPASWQDLLVREHASCVFITSKGEAVCFPAAA
jgi:thiamine biosynthesis lipoprotein